MFEHYDIAIAGASFAGLSLAKSALARGLRVLIMERKADPGLGIHTTGLLVKEIADEWTIPEQYTRVIPKVRLYTPNLKSIDLHSPGYSFLATDMAGLMRWYTNHISHLGAKVCLKSALTHVASSNNHQWLLPTHQSTCQLLIGADGARSRVAKCSGLAQNTQFLVGVEAEYENVGGVDEDYLHVFIDYDMAPGYIAWLVPGKDIIQVGLAATQGHRLRLQPFLDKIKHLFNFNSAHLVGRRGGLIPIGRPLKHFYNTNTLLVGDAAGWVSPLTAGGIHMAVHYAERAGHYCADYLSGGAEHPGKRLAAELPRYFFKAWLRKFANIPLSNCWFNYLLQLPPMQMLAKSIFFHHRGLFSYEVWRDLLTGRLHV